MQKLIISLITVIFSCFVIAGCGGGGGGSNSATGATVSVPGGTSGVSYSSGTGSGSSNSTTGSTVTVDPGTGGSGGGTSGGGTGGGSSTIPTTLTLSPITLGLSTISYGGSTGVTVTVKDSSGAAYTANPVNVTFTSTQTSLGKAAITSSVKTDSNGAATATYQASTATGTDTITAYYGGSTVTATITITPLAANSISFVSATPASIGLKGMGGVGITETSTVTFKVYDTAGQPKTNQVVDFALNTTLGGLSLLSSFGSTDASGTVTTVVQSGIIATSVRVTATLRGITPAIVTQSDQLVVSTGVPAQDGFSISIVTLNPEAYNIDGVTDKVTARLSDHFHNPVPDGTAVYFTTSGGSIQPSCVTSGGACTVTWTSQDPRPQGSAAPLQNKGRVRILAYAVGEEAFLDANGNGVADAGEFTDTSEAFRDDNENGTRDAGETFIDFNGNNSFDAPDGKYNGVLQGTAYIGAPKSKHVFSNTTLVMSTSGALITNSCAGNISVASTLSTSCNITVVDLNGNTMPAGTKVAFTYTSIVAGIKLTSTDSTFGNSSASQGLTFSVSLTDDGTAAAAVPSVKANGMLSVTVTTPGGVVSSATYSVRNP